MQKNYNENLVAGAAIRDDKGRRISKLFEAPHPKMTVGYAKNLIMPDDPTEQEFNFRQAGGGVIEDGVAVIDKVKGKSIVWNQKVKNATFINTSEWDATYSTFSVSGGIASVTASADGDNYTQQLVPMVVSHKYLYIFMAATDTANKNLECAYIFYGEASDVKVIKAKDDTNWHTYNAIVTCVSNTRNIVRIEVTKVGTSQFKNVSLIDLTQMFGAGNEPSTYEEFLQRKPFVEDEFAYNEGEIINNKVEKVVTTGRNLWDEEWESGGYNVNTGEKTEMSNRIRSASFIPCSGNTTYYFKSPATMYALWYDSGKSFISSESVANRVKTSPADACFLTIMVGGSNNPVISYGNDICINLSDPTINGQYFPYEKHELDLSWVKDIKDAAGVKLFEDGMKSAGTAFDEVGKNKAVKRIRKYVFDGSEPISAIQLNDDGTAFKVAYNTLFETTSNGVYSAISVGAGFYSKYNGGYYFDLWAAGFASVRGYIICVPSSVAKTSDEMKEYLKQKYDEGNPLVVYYELAEPIEVEYDEKSLTYPVVAGGTEEAIASEPSTAFRADIGYGIDAVKTILDLKARVEALEGK